MERRPRVLLDVDGVIVNFSRTYARIAGHIAGRHLPLEQEWEHWDMKESLDLSEEEVRFVHTRLNAPGVAKSMEAYMHAVEGVKRLFEIADVYFVTSPIEQSPTWCHDRLNWLIDRFGLERGRRIVFTYYKELVDGGMLVDDKPSNVEKWADAHPLGTAVLWSKPFNRHADPKRVEGAAILRGTSWDQLRNIVEGMT